MKGDFTRDTFDPAKHFSRVLMQQGRVQLDADWNEQNSILLHYLRTLAADLIGPYGAPNTNAGFQIFTDGAPEKDFFIGAGHLYVDGILCENDPGVLNIEKREEKDGNTILTLLSVTINNRELVDEDWIEILDKTEEKMDWHVAQIKEANHDSFMLTISLAKEGDSLTNPVQLKRLITYKQQQDYPEAPILADTTAYLVYLDVWERHIIAIEDGSIREAALAGPDTATRAKVVWQVKETNTNPATEENIPDTIDCTGIKEDWPQWVDGWKAKSACQLKVRLKTENPSDDPCITSPDSAYRGQENRLYRVEIHVGGKIDDETKVDGETKVDDETQPTFKWSRDNGSVVAAWLGNNDDDGLLVSSTHGFEVGQWIEITGEDQDLLGKPGTFVKIQRVEGGVLYLDSDQSPTWKKDQRFKVRRWDQTKTDESGTVPIEEPKPTENKENWIELENGLEIQFQSNGKYRTGDYWLIPARVTTGQIEWPAEVDADGHSNPIAQSPHGIVHHYAPLAFIEPGKSPTDLRCTFGPAGKCPQQE